MRDTYTVHSNNNLYIWLLHIFRTIYSTQFNLFSFRKTTLVSAGVNGFCLWMSFVQV